MGNTDTEAFKGFMTEQLNDMAKSVKGKYNKNQEKRENNPFLIFNDKNAKKYMGMGRSIDSQLGNRLQNIAFYAARERYGFENVPNIITINIFDEVQKLCMLSYPISLGCGQRVYLTDEDILTLLNKSALEYYNGHKDEFKISEYPLDIEEETALEVNHEFVVRDKKDNGIPIDLIYFTKESVNDESVLKAFAYEVKAGGNLDTKNAPSNANEVRSLKKIFNICDESVAKFATCYDGRGDGKPDGAIGSALSRDEIAVGKEFWDAVLPENIDYEGFISLYREAFKEAKVEEIITSSE